MSNRYKSNKRMKELSRQKKQEEKRLKRLNKKQQEGEETQIEPEVSEENEPAQA